MPSADSTDQARLEREERTIARALKVFERRARYGRPKFNCPADVRTYLRLRLDGLVREEFWAVWLDNQIGVIADECLFAGTLNQTSVYPREVVKKALAHNAASVIFAHNHPSGSTEPSATDISLTRCLKSALALVDVGVLDHFIVGSAPQPTSLAERSLF
ncbi:MAG: DNA repair protein RadC [Rhodocyclaceae bacterium]|nr:DNA repair protein RadC [Rhodocyclaceae bacterium]